MRKAILLPLVKAAELSSGKRFRQIYLFALLVPLLFGGVTFALSAFHKAYYPFGWDDDEGAVWWEAAHVTNLQVMYHPIQQYPYFVVPYPPVFHAVMRLAEEGTGDYLIAGRLVCVFSALGIGLLLGLLVWHVSPNRVPVRIRVIGAAVATLLCFCLDALNTYIPEIGVDLLALFFTFLGVYLFLRCRQDSKAIYWAFACFVAAVFTKQTMLAAPVACLVAATLMSRGKAVRYLLFCIALGTAGMGFLVWMTRGEILRHLFLYNAVQPFSFTHWITGMQANFMGMAPLAGVACLAVLPLGYRVFQGERKGSIRRLGISIKSSAESRTVFVLGLQLAVALLVSLTFGKIGSGVHYFLEWNFICCPLAAMLFVRVLADWRPGSDFNLGRAAVLLFVFFTALTSLPGSLRRLDNVYRLTPGPKQIQEAQYASTAAALQIVEQTPGPVLCENMVLVMKAHKEIPIEPGIQNFLAKAGVWDDAGFVNMITSQKFGVIIMRILDDGFWPDDVVQAIRNNYVLTEEIGDQSIEGSYYTVYRPRRSAP